MINLEIYLHDMTGVPLANVICNVLPREGDRVRIVGRSTPNAGLYRVLGYSEHLLDPHRVEKTQHVCIIVMRETE